MKLLFAAIFACVCMSADTKGFVSLDALRSCGYIDPLSGRLDAEPQCIFVHVKTENTQAAELLITATYTDDSGAESYYSERIQKRSGWSTLVIPLPTAASIRVDVEEFDSSGASLTWQSFSLF